MLVVFVKLRILEKLLSGDIWHWYSVLFGLPFADQFAVILLNHTSVNGSAVGFADNVYVLISFVL